MFKPLTKTIFFIILFVTNTSVAQIGLCDNCYVWEFTTTEGDRNQTTRLLSNDIEDIMSQFGECKVLQRSRYAKLLEQVNNEKEILTLNKVSSNIKTELKTIKARTVIFGIVNRDFQGNVSLRLSFENLATSQFKSNTVFLINEDYYNFDQRKLKLTEFIQSFIDPNGKLKSNQKSEDNLSTNVKRKLISKSFEDGPWKITLEDCKRTGSNVKLYLKVISKGEERVLSIAGWSNNPGTKIIDDQGREFRPEQFQIGNKVTHGHSIAQELVRDLPTPLVVTFQNVPDNAKKIMLFQVNLYGDNILFKFRNIDLGI